MWREIKRGCDVCDSSEPDPWRMPGYGKAEGGRDSQCGHSGA